MKLLCIVFLILGVSLSSALGSENCAMMNGQCRDVCTPDEEILEGAFIDCGDKQECCIARSSKEKGKDSQQEEQWKKPAE